MCYSAQIEADYLKFLRVTGAVDVSLREFFDRYWKRQRGLPLKMPKAVDYWFRGPLAHAEIAQSIAAFDAGEIAKLEQEVFKQKKRLADAERTLQTKITKKAQEDQRIATNKIEWALGKLADIKRTDPKPRDARIFPAWYVPVVVSEGGRRVVQPMRYQCRPAGKPAFYDTKYPGTYNARRDNLEGFWKEQFGRTHAVMVARRFYENVEQVGDNGKPHNVVLEFSPNNDQEMLVACLWSRWTDPSGKEPVLLSFAAITDEPPAEVAAAGHDRCIIPIKPEHLDAWLNPDPTNLSACYAILDDRERPYYDHRIAMAA